MTTRRQHRHTGASQSAPVEPTMPPQRKRRTGLWIAVGVLVVLIIGLVALGFVAKTLADHAFAAKADLEEAIPLVASAQEKILAGDASGAKEAASRAASLTKNATAETSGDLWRSLEWVPIAGPNLTAVRIAASSANDLMNEAVLPATELSLQAIAPVDGVFDIEKIQQLADLVAQASAVVERISARLADIDRSALIDQVAGGIDKLDHALAQVEPLLEPAHSTLTLLPTALGADGPRNYLLLFQNNAESRGTGGNPAAIALVTAENGKVSITQQASSSDFARGLPEPIIPLDSETEALYGDKIGRYIMDVTLTPDFPKSAELIRAFWAQSFGTPIDAVASFDPIALSYLLEATGPVTLPTGDILTAENAVSVLLSEVYSMYPDFEQQDIFFAAAARAVFDAITTAPVDPKALLAAFARAADESRLLYAPTSPAEAEIIAGTRIAGQLPASNSEATVLGAYVNDITEGKLDYYLQLDLTAQCSTADPAGYTVGATLTNTLTPEQARELAEYVAPGRFFARGDISTDLVLYGPVGSQLVSATIDGAPASVTPMPHLGRTAAKVNVLTQPGVAHNVTATFATPEGATGPLEVRHTPMVRQTPVTITQCS